jgi:hypothetical protein
VEEQISQYQIELQKVEAVVQLQETPGWKVVEDHFAKILEVVTAKLLIEDQQREVIRLQEKHRAFSSMLKITREYSLLKEHLQLQIEELKAMQDEINIQGE